MHCALRRTRSNTQKVSDGGKGSILRKSSELNGCRTSTEGCESLSLVCRNSDHRLAFVTFLVLEPDGQWKIVALPLQFRDHSSQLESGGHVKMDGLHLVSPPHINSFKADRQKVQRGPPHDNIFSVKPYTARSFSGSNVQHKARNKALVNTAAKFNELSGNSCPNLFSGGDSSSLILSGCTANDSSDMPIDHSKVGKTVRKNSRNKARKKGKQKKKRSCDSGSTELEANSEEYVHGSSTSETCTNNDMDHQNEFVSCAAVPSILLTDCRANRHDFGADSNDIINCSENHKRCTPSNDDLNALEAVVPSAVQDSTNEHPTDKSENGLILDEEENVCCDDSHSQIFSDMPDSILLDPVSVGWNSDDSTTAGDDEKASNGESNVTNSSEPPGYPSRKGCFSHLNSLNGVVDSYNHAVGVCCQVHNSQNTQLVLPGKRGTEAKRAPKNSNVHIVGSVGNLHSRTGKENNHSVWQKVQKNDATELDYEVKKANPVCSDFSVSSKEDPVLKRKSNAIESNILSKPEDKKSNVKSSRNLKKKSSQGSKQSFNCYSKKGSHTVKVSSNAPEEINLQQNEILNIPAEVNNSKGFASVLQIGSPSIGFGSEGVECVASETDGLQSLGHVYNSVSSIDDQTTEDKKCPMLKSHDSLNQSNFLEVQPPVYYPPLVGNEVSEVDKGASLSECSKRDCNSGSVLQKWVPVGLKQPELTSSGKYDISSSHLDAPGAEICTLKNIPEEERVSNSQNLVSAMNTGVTCMIQDSGSVNCYSENDGQTLKFSNQITCIPIEHSNKPVSASCSALLSNGSISTLAAESDKIAQAINDACRLRLASEIVQLTIGSPIAEFERVLHSASPAICQSQNIRSCQTCLQGQANGASLCRHETPNISLGSLWQWYERHGVYGLEVRAEYENSKRLGSDHSAFRAYFVPFLSAVQLFGNHESSTDDKGSPGGEILEACEKGEMSEDSSNIDRLPIFSILIPQPQAMHTKCLLDVNQACSSESSLVSSRDDISAKSDGNKWSDDAELLFEFFEFEQPQQRRPLFEKFSVAWYPIYKIPDGNFHAAFLTYHSLGHLVHRSTAIDSSSMDGGIVLPVVGLQSYNAQGECWFQLKQSAVSQPAEIPSLGPSKILKERLRTLEHTASLMARAAVSKGKLTSVNRHPDYEFFLSRRR
ncbi:uncharacterized protein LOC131157715 isoform X2 [Malania oleifera]|uniref:uncharacterized protein LOC131157715 isoform X2 n=1 Tax=Malania oleifera TaxID=397392 RepID=UPI0025AE3CF0|nr:uncharacterized protein LOC131157715 isoform X2 [Malania oleifera]